MYRLGIIFRKHREVKRIELTGIVFLQYKGTTDLQVFTEATRFNRDKTVAAPEIDS